MISNLQLQRIYKMALGVTQTFTKACWTEEFIFHSSVGSMQQYLFLLNTKVHISYTKFKGKLYMKSVLK